MVELADFECLYDLHWRGKGKIFQARIKHGDDNNQIYTIKSVELKLKQAAREKSILPRIKHPMVVELFYTFEDKDTIYFVLEYQCGGILTTVLFDHIKEAICEQCASFYVKEVIVALEYLHSEGIIYKNLYHSNILLDINGHIKLIDFGCSEENITRDTLSFDHSVTPHFKAPEVRNKTGHGFAVDWWSLGVFFHRLVTGLYPFVAIEEYLVKKPTLTLEHTLRENFTTNAKHLITGLLQVNPKERLGYTDGAAAVKNHPYFANTSWENVSQRGETPPFVPVVANANDTSRYGDQPKLVATCSITSISSFNSKRSQKPSTPSAGGDSKICKKRKLNTSNESLRTSAPREGKLIIAQPTTASPEAAPPATTPPETAPSTL